MSTTVAVVLLLAVMAYAVFGGADFGAGFWDLTSGGPERGAGPRGLIERAIGPVWEANHVWLIFIFVVLWTSFPEAYASITLTLFVPLTIAALGIVLRGAALRSERPSSRCAIGASSALASRPPRSWFPIAWVPLPAGSPPAGCRRVARPATPWTAGSIPTSVLCGVLGLAVAAYLSAVFLVWDARRLGEPGLVTHFRLRAVIAAVVIGVVGLTSVFVLRNDAHYLFDGLTSKALPLVIVSVVSGVGALVLLVRDAARGARVLAVAAVASLVVAWGVAQWPYLLPESLTVSAAAAPTGTLTAVLVAVALAAVVVLPAIALLFFLDQRSLLPEEGVDDAAESQVR